MNEGSARHPVAGIIVTHGRLAEALLDTAELIIGTLEDIHPISGSDLCDDSIVERIRGILAGAGQRNAVVFVDYFGGSCCTNSVRAVEGIPGIKVLSGVNLPMLLDFATKRDTLKFDDMVDHLIRRGRESVRLIDL